jgi:hypothetical protein
MSKNRQTNQQYHLDSVINLLRKLDKKTKKPVVKFKRPCLTASPTLLRIFRETNDEQA